MDGPTLKRELPDDVRFPPGELFANEAGVDPLEGGKVDLSDERPVDLTSETISPQGGPQRTCAESWSRESGRGFPLLLPAP